MDSITQATLGAAVGEAFLGKKAGYRAAAWGVVLGTIPDLDIIINPFVDSVVELRSHRGFTHSILFCLLAAPAAGWLIDNIHKSLEVGWVRWSVMAFFTFLTHILIDLPTTYGTQIFRPFTDTPYTLDSIFIIDPFFTIPLFVGLVTALVLRRDSRARTIANRTGLLISALYLIWGYGIKSHVHSVFIESYQQQYGAFEQIKTTPNGPSTFLWTGYIENQDTIYNAVYSIFDERTDLNFTSIPKNSHLIEPYRDHRAIQTLLWFSRGYYKAEIEEGQLIIYDLRFGRGDFWLTDDASYVWKNHILINEAGYAHSFEQSIPNFNTRTANLSRYWNRLWGKPH
ncbi:metal-dependent hydrolase [Rhodohalobacter halophilus]|uniref:metal-dependent hydrolase n=1 Tax=Rhodohalobacter halophilus TaxID=1812810 RepID=UPI00083F7D80|nr:metal-dependent hydrolase [Rhodohalobacter halophilus]